MTAALFFKPIPPGDEITPLSKVPSGRTPLLSQQEIRRTQQMEALKDLSQLLDLVTEQENQYGDRLSLHSDYYC